MRKRVAIDGSTLKHTTGGLSVWDAILEKCKMDELPKQLPHCIQQAAGGDGLRPK
jgi:hypothetical protein